MSESVKEEIPGSPDKDTLPIALANSSVELGDRGILVHTAPLTRKLARRHVQMIAIDITLLAFLCSLCYKYNFEMKPA